MLESSMGKGILPYLLLAVAAITFSGYFIVWGIQQGPVGDITKAPQSFSVTSVIASILFFGSTWFVIHRGSKNPKVSYPKVSYPKVSYVVLGGLIVWYAAVVLLGMTGFFAAQPLFAPNIIFAFILLFFAGKWVLSMPTLQNAFNAVPLHWVFTVQVFRVMGVGFLSLYAMRILPGEFAIPTGIGDILVGIAAPAVAYLYASNAPGAKQIAVTWNYLGIADLVMAISLGIATYSKPFQLLPTEIPNDPIALHPLVIIPVFAVPLSILLHLFSLRKLKTS